MFYAQSTQCDEWMQLDATTVHDTFAHLCRCWVRYCVGSGAPTCNQDGSVVKSSAINISVRCLFVSAKVIGLDFHNV